MGLCKLADIQHRINRAAEHDDHQVSCWLDTERARSANSETSLAQRQQRIKFLKGEDEQRVVEASFGGLQSELGVLTEELSRAEAEEEQARKVSSSVM